MKTFKFIFLLSVMLSQMHFAFGQSDNKKTANMSGEVMLLTKKDFLEKIYNYEKNKDRFVYEGTLPCIIDFYADWCGPCKKVEPILKELAKEYQGKVLFYKIDTDRERDLKNYFEINSIPTYFFIPPTGMPQSALGARPREFFVKVINEFLLKK